jgi:hypothetical protein
MDTKKLCLLKLKEIDLLTEQILNLEKNKQKIYVEISQLKESIVLENQKFINQKAVVEDSRGKHIILPCISIRCGEDFEPIFQFNSREERNKFAFVSWVNP